MMPRQASRIQKVTSVFDEPRLSIVRGRRADCPDKWEAEMRLGRDKRRVYRTLKAKDAERASVEAYKLFVALDGEVAAGRPISGPSFKKLAPLYREFLDKKIAANREKHRHRPGVAEAKAKRTQEKNYHTFVSRLLPAFGDLPVAGISQQHLAKFVAGLSGRGGGSAALRTIKSLNGVFRQAMRCGIKEGWITREAIPCLPTDDQARPAPRPAFTAKEWRDVILGMSDRWVETGLTAVDDERNAGLAPKDRYRPRRVQKSVENRRIARAYAVILAASQTRPGTELDFIRPADFVLNDPDREAAIPSVMFTVSSGGKTSRARTIRIRGENADAVRAAISDVRRANPAMTDTSPLFARPSDQRIISPLKTLQTYLARIGLLLDPVEGTKRSLYSVRHTTITLRVANGVNSGQVAAESGTSLPMMEQFYVKRSHLVGTQIVNPLLPPELRPTVSSPYRNGDGGRLVVTPGGAIRLAPTKSSEPSRGDAVQPVVDDRQRHARDTSPVARSPRLALHQGRPYPEGCGHANAPRSGGLAHAGPDQKGVPNSSDPFRLDGWSTGTCPLAARAFQTGGDCVLVLARANGSKRVEPSE
jgi:hypothetical protein